MGRAKKRKKKKGVKGEKKKKKKTKIRGLASPAQKVLRGSEECNELQRERNSIGVGLGVGGQEYKKHVLERIKIR